MPGCRLLLLLLRLALPVMLQLATYLVQHIVSPPKYYHATALSRNIEGGAVC